MSNDELLKKIRDLYQQNAETNAQYMSLWMEEILFSWRWWVSVVLTIAPWAIWAIFRKRESTLRLLSIGFFTMFLTAWMDYIGVDLGYWYYPVDAIPFAPSFIPYDFCLFPVLVMTLLQFKPRISPYWKAAFFSVFNTFVAEPLLEFLEFYEELRWSPMYSLPIYFAIYLLASWLYHRKSYNL